MRDKDYTLELGPIRPPSEAASILLRLTRNCPWNKCAFCHSYKNTKFSKRTSDEIINDIDSIHAVLQLLKQYSSVSGHIHNETLRTLMQNEGIPYGILQHVVFWFQHGLRSLFLQDADSLVMKTGEVVAILNYIHKKIPTIERTTTYARARTLARKSMEDLKQLRSAGLSRIHSGYETGSDRILSLIQKGTTSEEQLRAGMNVIEAGFEFSEYFIPGIGGKEHSMLNATESAKILNKINPSFIRIRSIVPLPDTPLFKLLTDNKWQLPSDEDKIKELRIFIEHLENITSTVKSDHIMNLLEDVEGILPHDKEKMLNTIDTFLLMEPQDRESFIIGRRIGAYRTLSDFHFNNEVENLKQQLKKNYASIDEGLLQVLWNFI